MIKQLQPQIFIGNVTDADYPLWGILLGVIVSGVVIVGIRWRQTRGDIGDCGLIVFNVYFGVEWGGGEKVI